MESMASTGGTTSTSSSLPMSSSLNAPGASVAASAAGMGVNAVTASSSSASTAASSGSSSTLGAASGAASTPTSTTTTSSSIFLPSSLSQQSILSTATVSQLLSQWQTVSLQTLCADWESRALTIPEHTERSIAARKQLAETTRNLKKAPNENKLALLGPVVKQYQTEINELTMRSKQSEEMFLHMYQVLVKLTQLDPTLYLEAFLKQLQSSYTMEKEMLALKTKVKEYDEEFSQLSNQSYTIKKLSEEVKMYERSFAEKLEEKEKQIREQLQEQHHGEMDQLKAMELEYEKKVSSLTETYDRLLHRYTQLQNEVLSDVEKLETERGEHERTLEVYMMEIETLRNQLTNERRSKNGNMDDLGDIDRNTIIKSEVDRICKEKDDDIRLLQLRLNEGDEKNSKYKKELESLQRTLGDHNRVLVDENMKLSREIDVLKGKLKDSVSKSEYRSVLNQLHQWEEMELQSEGHDSEEIDGSAIDPMNAVEIPESSSKDGDSLPVVPLTKREMQLCKKNKHLSNEILEKSRLYDEERKAKDELKKKYQEVNEGIEKDKQLIAKLEQDLLELQRNVHSSPISANIIASATSISPSTDSSTPSTSDNSLLAITSGQRDRYRERCEAYEKQLSEVNAHLRAKQSQLESLQADNLRLFEKLQYVRSFASNRNSSSKTIGASMENPSSFTDINIAMPSLKNDTESRYSELYEEKLHPFAAFKRKAMVEREKALPPSERFTLMLTRLVVDKRVARSVFFFYALILHSLVFIVLWTHTVQPHCENEQHF